MLEPNPITLPDGRKLAYNIYGTNSFRHSLIYCHGFPGSRYEAGFAHATAVEADITILSLDRPGFGLSESYPGRKLLDWAKDVQFLADQLEIDQFHLLAVSGGVPYALACAHEISDRVINCGLVSGLGPHLNSVALAEMNLLNRSLLELAITAPQIASFLVNSLGRLFGRYPSLFLAWLKFVSTPSDRQLLSQAEFKEFFIHSLSASLNSKTCRIGQDLSIIARPWGFNLETIRVPTFFWHGLADQYVPASMSRLMATKIPNSSLQLLPQHGHFMILKLAYEVLGKLVA